MPAPVINTTTSVIEGFQWQPLAYQPFASNNPTAWACPNLPAGLSLDAPIVYAATGVASTDVITATGNTFADGDRVVMPELTGGAGLTANVIYFVRDRSGATLKLAATRGGSAINFTTDISAATISKVPTGKISGSPEVSGTFVMGLTASNADGSSAEVVLTIGIGAAEATLTNSGFEVEIDVVTRHAKLVGGADVKLFARLNDDLLIWAKFKKGGQVLDLDIDSMEIALNETDSDPRIVLGTDWLKFGSGTGTYYGLHAKVEGGLVQAALDNNVGEKETFFDALSEIGWVENNADHPSFGPATLRFSTRPFLVTLAMDQGTTA